MRATVMFGAGEVRIENVPVARIIEPTDAVITVTRVHSPCGKRRMQVQTGPARMAAHAF
jgi:threonine dehydrogenase-like Zn-dependent dehydrogenase